MNDRDLCIFLKEAYDRMVVMCERYESVISYLAVSHPEIEATLEKWNKENLIK